RLGRTHVKITNQTAIRQGIRNALNQIESEYEDIQLLIEEATRNMPGSPNIPATIFAKISNSDIFICDLTTINSSDSTNRKVPNPNVLIELGYAIAKLGWSRIILLFNTNFGDFPNDMPFDIDRHRASNYCIIDKNDNNGKKNLSSLLKIAIKTIIEQDPIKESDNPEETEEEKKRRLDIANLKWLMNSFHINSFDTFIEYMPDFIISRIFYFKDGFIGTMDSSHFHLYDKKLLQLIIDFRNNWVKSLSFSEHYGPDNAGKGYNYYIPADIFPNEKSEKDFHFLVDLRNILIGNLKSLLDYIRTDYLEVNLEETSKTAFENYKSFMDEE
ncbi:MAG TPA: hypothetical protein DEH15_12330, partial [Marinilabiliales bacterium]|nr:hypothetical protein [Marinilabiliales bacterium]HBY53218.1 hypothetical protein [Marinilabiliales bacterium]